MMSTLLPLHIFLVFMLVLSSGDLRNKLDVDKTREICSCPLPLLQSTIANIDVKGKWYTVGYFPSLYFLSLVDINYISFLALIDARYRRFPSLYD